MKRLIAVIILLFFSSQLFCQVKDYKAIRDSVYVSKCGSRTRGEVRESILNLEYLNVNSETKGADSYHYDLGMCYYLLSINENFDEVGLRSAIGHYEKTIEYNKQHSGAYWNIAFIYGELNQCEDSAKYLKLYKKHTKRRYMKDNRDQIDRLEKNCGV